METILLTIDRVVEETNDSKSYYLSAYDGSFPTYKAGQFITIIIDIDGKEIRRSYSFGSTPGVDAQPFITIRRIENGIVSRYLLRYLKEGDKIKALSPAGRFTIEDRVFEEYFLIAAGSGITPIFSLLKEILFFKPKTNVTLLFQNNNEASSIYRAGILELRDQFDDRFRLIELFSHPLDPDYLPKRLNNYLLEKIIQQESVNEDVQMYICGPPSFMRMADFTLRVIGFKEEQIKKENFVVGFVPKAPLVTDTTPKNVFIKYKGQAYTLRVGYPHNILEVALENGLELPYSCRGGRCSACTARCIKGKVIMSINEVLTEKDLQSGLILTCVGYPATDAELVFE